MHAYFSNWNIMYTRVTISKLFYLCYIMSVVVDIVKGPAVCIDVKTRGIGMHSDIIDCSTKKWKITWPFLSSPNTIGEGI